MMDGASRRNVLKLNGRVFCLAGSVLASCGPKESFHVKGVARLTSLVSLSFIRRYESRRAKSMGLLVEVKRWSSHQMRQIPSIRGALARKSFHQASILHLYDPDRPLPAARGRNNSTWEAFDGYAKKEFDPAKLKRRIGSVP